MWLGDFITRIVFCCKQDTVFIPNIDSFTSLIARMDVDNLLKYLNSKVLCAYNDLFETLSNDEKYIDCLNIFSRDSLANKFMFSPDVNYIKEYVFTQFIFLNRMINDFILLNKERICDITINNVDIIKYLQNVTKSHNNNIIEKTYNIVILFIIIMDIEYEIYKFSKYYLTYGKNLIDALVKYSKEVGTLNKLKDKYLNAPMITDAIISNVIIDVGYKRVIRVMNTLLCFNEDEIIGKIVLLIIDEKKRYLIVFNVIERKRKNNVMTIICDECIIQINLNRNTYLIDREINYETFN